MLKRILAIAIFMAILKLNKFIMKSSKILNGFIKIENKTTVPILKKRLKWASFFESFSAFNMP